MTSSDGAICKIQVWGTKMKRCKRCIIPEVPGVTFNKDGICSCCLSYEEEKCLGKEELDKIISSIRKKDNRYDCIVPLSGGRDSTFVLYVAKKIYDLKVLAVNYDNEFRTDQAVINMENACKRLNIDFLSVRSKRNIAQQMVKCAIRSSVSIGYPCLCRACEYGYRAVIYRAAEKYKVPLILWGQSSAEKLPEAFINLGRNKSLRKFLKLLKVNFYKVEFCALLQKLEFYVPGTKLFKRSYLPTLKNKDIKEVRLFDYIPWDRKKIKETIINELGWKKPQGHVSTWRTDCTLHDLANYYSFKRFGCSRSCFGYTKMINSKQIDREEALKQEEEMAANYVENIRELLEDKIGLSEKEADKILSFDPQVTK